MEEQEKQQEAPTVGQLTAQLQEAMGRGDYKLIAKLAGDMAKAQKAAETAELEAKQKALADITIQVKSEIETLVRKLAEAGKLDVAEGVWFTWDFGEASTTCKLIKAAPRKSSPNAGKRFDISTRELLEAHGAEQFKDEMTYQEFYDTNTDKNSRFAVRSALLKLAGYIS